MRLDTEITSRCQTVPGWISCDQAVSVSSVWSSVVTAQMAEHARVLALSILDTWDPAQGPAPDLRLVIIEPASLNQTTLARLQEAGWGLCHTEMPDIMMSGVIPQYRLAYSKLFVWNMTQYQTLLWMDSDTIVARSIHKLFLRADRYEKEKTNTFTLFILHLHFFNIIFCSSLRKSRKPIFDYVPWSLLGRYD